MAQGAAAAVIPPEVLGRIPGCENGRPPLAVSPLPGGRGRNLVLRVDTGEGRFVWRRRHAPVDRPGSAALTELRGQQLAAGAGLVPQVLAAHPGGEWLLMEFFDAPMWTAVQLEDRDQRSHLGATLARLHAIAVPADLPAMDGVAIARGHQARLGNADAAAAAGIAAMVARIDDLGRELSEGATRRALNHGDLAVANMLGPGPRLIDWEYAQITDPTYDLACLVAYYPQLERHLDHLMGTAGLDSGADRARLGLQRERFALVNRLWEQVQPPGAG